VQIASRELRRSVIGIATKQVNGSAMILSRSFNQSPSLKLSKEIGFSDSIHESREFTESGPFSQSNGCSFSAVPTVSHFDEPSKVIGFSEFVHQSRQFTQSALFSVEATKSQGLSGGALAGLIVGGVSFLALLICFIALRFFRTDSISNFDSNLKVSSSTPSEDSFCDVSQLEHDTWLE
jgi:hypothetical protein